MNDVNAGGKAQAGSGPNAWRQVVAVLADEERLRLFARVVVGDLAEEDLSREDRRRLGALEAAGLVVRDRVGASGAGAGEAEAGAGGTGASGAGGTDAGGPILRANPARFAALLAQGPPAPSGPERFLVDGRLVSLPRRLADREEMLHYLAARALPLLEEVTEPALTRRLGEIAADPVAIRRALVDAGIVTRTRDGIAYWRTHVTEFDAVTGSGRSHEDPGPLDSGAHEDPGAHRALAALDAAEIAYTIDRYGPVSSLAEAARVRGLRPAQILKTLVVRRGDDDYLFVLVPGDRRISWPKLRALLGVSRLSMPDRAGALEVTGYEPGTITPFGSLRAWPVVADAHALTGAADDAGRLTVSIGAGERGTSAVVDTHELVRVLEATVADVSEPLDGAG